MTAPATPPKTSLAARALARLRRPWMRAHSPLGWLLEAVLDSLERSGALLPPACMRLHTCATELAPVLVGASRKRFIGEITGATAAERLPGNLAVALWSVAHGAAVLRVHDVAATRAALRMTEALGRIADC